MLRTAIAGSLPKPAWLAEPDKLWPQWRASGAALDEAKRDATLLWIKAQEDAGLSTIGDGEQSRTALWNASMASTSSTRSRSASATTATRRWCRRWWGRCR